MACSLIFCVLLAIHTVYSLTPILQNGTFGEPFVATVNNSVEYIIEYTGEMVV